ncbi:hypothetical protein G7Y79_00116g101790 [Physcia stellaris]|nr:hypothetical protein G7Y79_00116g101790 [Physcia stellaris]
MKSLQIALGIAAIAVSIVTALPHLDAATLDALKLVAEGKCPYAAQQAATRNEKECPHLKEELKRRAVFDPVAQKVSTTGTHAWVAPKSGDQRGPCPGLNALANHGYLPHNGVADIPTIIQAVNTVVVIKRMAVDLGSFPRNLRFSMGNDYLLQIDQFQQYYNALLDNTPAPQQYSALFPFRQARFNDSISKNPYFFFPQFAGVLVSPAGYAFPPAMMANHSADYPQGYLDKQTFKSFFAVTGNSGAFKYTPGYERIPDNWYKRPVGDEYTIPGFLSDINQYGLRDSRLLSPGGNTGTPNSFVGVDPSNLSKGVFNAASLTKGNNLECFTFQLVPERGTRTSDVLVQGRYRCRCTTSCKHR